ncbi:MAG: hypothetical protein IPM23_25545 [Candidatus Melainabacteria bacterium]|nr:hypothetical protein [Candidatus Melainabacteria bacterium]
MNVDKDLKLNFDNLGEPARSVFREPPERFFEGAVVSKRGLSGGGGTPELVRRSPGYLAII